MNYYFNLSIHLRCLTGMKKQKENEKVFLLDGILYYLPRISLTKWQIEWEAYLFVWNIAYVVPQLPLRVVLSESNRAYPQQSQMFWMFE